MNSKTFVVNGREYRLGEKFGAGSNAAPRHLLRENVKQLKSQSKTLLTHLVALREAAQPVHEFREIDRERRADIATKLASTTDSEFPVTTLREWFAGDSSFLTGSRALSTDESVDLSATETDKPALQR